MKKPYEIIGNCISLLCVGVSMALLINEPRINKQYIKVDPVVVTDFTSDNNNDLIYKTRSADDREVLALVRHRNVFLTNGEYSVNDLGEPILVAPPEHMITGVEAGDYNNDGYTDIRIYLETPNSDGLGIDLNNDGEADIRIQPIIKGRSTYLGDGRGDLDFHELEMYIGPENIKCEQENPEETPEPTN